jgi:hypothetical protein
MACHSASGGVRYDLHSKTSCRRSRNQSSGERCNTPNSTADKSTGNDWQDLLQSVPKANKS